MSDLRDQIMASEDYIRARYGSREGMRQSWEQMGWYDYPQDAKAPAPESPYLSGLVAEEEDVD